MAIATAIIPATNHVNNVVSPSGIAWSRTSRSRNGETSAIAALSAISARTALSRRR